MPTKPQRLRNTAEGFMAGLVGAGFDGPFRWAHHQWEGPFYRAWNDWTPRLRQPEEFPRFRVGAAGGTFSQARELLWQLKRGSPFHAYGTEALPEYPHGLSIEDYLAISVRGASPAEWIALSAGFLGAISD